MKTWEERENHPHRLIQSLCGHSVYETKSVKRGRNTKTCEACEATIPKGHPASSIIFYGDGCDWPATTVCVRCMDGAPEKEKEHALIQEILQGKWDVEY